MEGKEGVMCTPVQTSSRRTASPGEGRYKQVFLTSPGLRKDLPGSIECTPEVLRSLVSPPPGFGEHSPEQFLLMNTSRRLEYVDVQTDKQAKLREMIEGYVERTQGVGMNSTIEALLLSLGSSPCVSTSSAQTDDSLLESELSARLYDIHSLRAHINSLAHTHSEAIKSLHSSYKTQIQQLTAENQRFTQDLQQKLTFTEEKLRNLIQISGLNPENLQICPKCEDLKAKLVDLTDKLVISQDYIRKKALNFTQNPAFTVQNGRELRSIVHKQVIFIEEMLQNGDFENIKEEFLKLPYMLKPIFDQLREFEREFLVEIAAK